MPGPGWERLPLIGQNDQIKRPQARRWRHCLTISGKVHCLQWHHMHHLLWGVYLWEEPDRDCDFGGQLITLVRPGTHPECRRSLGPRRRPPWHQRAATCGACRGWRWRPRPGARPDASAAGRGMCASLLSSDAAVSCGSWVGLPLPLYQYLTRYLIQLRTQAWEIHPLHCFAVCIENKSSNSCWIINPVIYSCRGELL